MIANKISPDEVQILNIKIENAREENNKQNAFRHRFIRDKKVNNEDRFRECSDAEKEKDLFMSAISGKPIKYQRCFSEFEMSLNTRAYMEVTVKGTDDECIKTMSKPCPKCHSALSRTEGCNHMTCGICHYQFSFLCLQPWSTHNSSYFVCPNYRKSIELESGKSKCGIDFNDKNDMKFCPPPMNVDKISEFNIWSNSYKQNRKNKEKYDELYKEVRNTVDKIIEKNGVVYSQELCLKTKLFNILKNDMNDRERPSAVL